MGRFIDLTIVGILEELIFMSLGELRKTWDALAVSDPWRAILGRPGEGKQWDAEEFFLSGEYEVNGVMQYAGTLGLPGERRTALDFGCGAGRLTQALAEHFESATGVDVSPAMLELARQHNRKGERCRYVLNESGDLAQFVDGSFDFIYSNITLQHLRPKWIRAYLGEFVRVLAPGGLLVFHLPSHRVRPAMARLMPGNSFSLLARLLSPVVKPGKPVIEMYGMSRDDVDALLGRRAARLLDTQEGDSSGSDWLSYRYAVTRPEAVRSV